MPAALRQQHRSTSPRSSFLPVLRVENPFDHAAALWPGLLEGNPVGGKSILRPRSELAWVTRQPRLSLIVRGRASRSPGEDTLADELLFVSAKPEAGGRDAQLDQIAAYLHSLAGARECYISVNTFFGRRNQANLKHLTALMVDLDLNKSAERGHDFAGDFMAQRQRALDALSAAGIPPPNVCVHTGKGVHLYWLFDRCVPAAALPRWQACHEVLIRLLRPYGSDENVRDAARVLRLVGTINSSAPEHCRTVTAEVLVPARHAFDFLADQILPLTRADLHSARQVRLVELAPRRAARAARRQLLGAGPSGSTPRRGRSYGATATARLTDLTLLAATLFPGGVTQGQRDRYLFAATCNLAWICRQETLADEMLAWKQRHVPSLSDSEALAMMGTALRKAEEAYQALSAGTRFSPYDDPRYVHAAATLWEVFGADIERAGLQSQMQAILPAGVLQERQKAAKRAQSLDHYTGQGIRLSNVPRALKAREMRRDGQTLREIAEALSTTPKTVSSWLDLAPAALGLNAPAAAPPDAQPPITYPQARPVSTERTDVLPKSLLNNGVAKRFSGKASEMQAAEGGSGGRITQGSGLDAQVPAPAQIAGGPAIQPPSGSIQGQVAAPAAEPSDRRAPTEVHAAFGRALGKPPEHFGEDLLREMRRWPLQHGLRTLGLHFKSDPSYVPRTGDERLHVTIDSGQVFELIVTGIRWFDTRASKGGGGVIDLAMHLFGCTFVEAVRRLNGLHLGPSSSRGR